MRLLKLPRLLVLAFALLLAGGQQAAFAHMIGHLAEFGDAAATVVAEPGDDDHGAALTLSHVCTTCLTLDHFAAPLPAPVPAAFGTAVTAVPASHPYARPPLAPARHYAARAPPAPF